MPPAARRHWRGCPGRRRRSWPGSCPRHGGSPAMLWLAAGAGVLLLLLGLAQGFAGARVETVRKAGFWFVGILAVAVVGLLLLSGRAGQMLWTLALFAPIFGRRVQGWWARWRFRQRADAAEGVSAVETATLA